jgi:probable phosphoglycerate mutase
MTTFYLIRHAERLGPARLLAGRMPGLSLTPSGRAHADRIARALAREPVHHIFSSPLERAQETAAPLGRLRKIPVTTANEIGEIDFGEWTGRTFDELASDPRWMQFNRVRSTALAPGGESLAGVQQRFTEAMRAWTAAYPDAGVALFSHADPIKTALAHYLALPLALFDRLEVGLGSISVVEADAEGGRVIRLNEISPAFAA